MSTNTLKGIVEATLLKFGKEMTGKIVPELYAIDVPTPALLASLLLDSNNTVFRENALLDVFKYFSEAKDLNMNHITGSHQREMETRLSKAELRHVSRHCSAGIVLTQLSNGISLAAIDGPSAGKCDEAESCYEYLPLIGLATGNQDGPIKSALDDLFMSRINKGRSRNSICTRFLANLLHLWREILTLWMGGQISITQSAAKETTIPMEAPMDIIPESPSKGKKRARSPEEMDDMWPASKRTARNLSWGSSRPETPTQEGSSRQPTEIPVIHSPRKKDPQISARTSHQVPQVQGSLPFAIRALIDAFPSSHSLSQTIEVNITEQFVPKTFAAHFGSGASGSWCGWLAPRRLKSFRAGVGNNQIIRTSYNVQPFRPTSACSTGVLLEFPGCNDYRRPLGDEIAARTHFYTSLTQPDNRDWIYCGEYRLIPQEEISWADLPQYIQKKWLDLTYVRRDQDGFRETLKEQVGAHVSKISIERAFENGHIKLRALVMQCVDYHEDIQKAIISMNAGTLSNHNFTPQPDPPPEWSLW